MSFLILTVLLVIIAAALIACIKIVPESRVYVVERFGKYNASLSSGLNFIIPFVDTVRRVVTLKEQVADFQPLAVITKDNATMQIDTVVYFRIVDPKLFAYGVERPIAAIENLTATTLRNIIGDMTVDETLTSRDTINTQMRVAVDEATDAWGIKVNRVELKTILPPNDIRAAMEKEMKAEREKRASILEAQARRESAILVAEGEKQAAILRAEAKKEQAIREAEGESMALELLNNRKPSKEILALKSIEAFEKIANGKATKIFIPTDFRNISNASSIFSEINDRTPEKNQ